MDFASLPFLFVFLPAFLFLWLTLKPEYRFALLFISNLVFIYVSQVSSLLPLMGIALIGYFLGRGVDKSRKREKYAPVFMWSGVVVLLGLLLAQKILIGHIPVGGAEAGLNFQNVLPLLGLSYISFQIIAYLADVSHGAIPAEKNIFQFILYILFFPKIVSGPITKYKFFKNQISSLEPNFPNIADGLRRILQGVIKRLLIANQLGTVADAVFNLDVPNVAPLIAWLALIAYTLQLYYDFSGYTDIALGLGKIIGINLPENFEYPYTSQSIGEFWRRWHMTLSSWFREYVFYPLERKRFRVLGQQINVVVVFLLTGLWHGVTANFLVWGGIHGVAIAIESLIGRWQGTIWRPFRHIVTLFVIMVGWVFFRSPSIEYALLFLGRLFGNEYGITPLPFSMTAPLPFLEPTFILVLMIAVIFSMPVTRIWKNFCVQVENNYSWSSIPLRALEDLLIVFLFILSLSAQLSGTFQPSIYAAF